MTDLSGQEDIPKRSKTPVDLTASQSSSARSETTNDPNVKKEKLDSSHGK
jgi:hypothetical protein